MRADRERTEQWEVPNALSRLSPLLALAAPSASPVDTVRTTSYRGQTVTYAVVDGMAVHDGDILLGTAEQAAAAPAIRKLGSGPRPRFAAPREGEGYRWPQATIPYFIGPGFSADAEATIRAAIDAWNSKTVISLVPWAGQSDFVRFTAATSCRSFVGRRGGGQFIHLNAGGRCTLSATIHEIGHAVGLFHEHQRPDRDDRVMIRTGSVPHSAWRSFRFGRGHGKADYYDYASVMNYARPFMDSIPPGIHFRGDGGLSPGDIDGVARMYGQSPTVTTVSTNPPGLEVVIDGIATVTPASLNWPADSTHTLEVATTPQVRGNTRYFFGRWNDGEPQVRTVTAGSRTWFEANFIVQRRISPQVLPSGSGTVTVEPHSPDGWHTIRTTASATVATTEEGRLGFLRWEDGLTSNPRSQIVLPPMNASSGMRFPPPFLRAHFSAVEPFRVESTTDRFYLTVAGRRRTGPLAFLRDQFGGTVTLSVPVLESVPGFPDSRHRFRGWSDGGSSERTVDLAAAGGTELTADLSVEHRLSTPLATGGGSVVLSPHSDEGFYGAGTTVQLTARPDEGWDFVSWAGDIDASGIREASAEIKMEGPRRVVAAFSQTPRLPTGNAGTGVTLPGEAGTLGYRVDPDPAATSLAISFSSESAANVDLYVKTVLLGSAPGPWSQLYVNREMSTWDPKTDADYRSEASGSTESVQITASSVPPLNQSASYYLTLATAAQPDLPIEGVLRLATELRSGSAPPSGRAVPRALTFVSSLSGSPAQQTIRLTNEGGSDMNYSANSTGITWLLVTAGTGTIAPRESADLQVQALPTGLAAGTYDGTLTIERSASTGIAFDPIEIPVLFVAY